MVLIVESRSSINEYQNEFAPEPDRSLSRALNRMAWPGLSTPHFRHRRAHRSPPAAVPR